MPRKKEQIIFIEYIDSKLFAFSTRTRDDHDSTSVRYYDVEWCWRDGRFYYHCSAVGGDEQFTICGTDRAAHGNVTTYWAAEGVKVVRGNDAPARLRSRSLSRKRIESAIAGGSDDGFVESECEYCEACDDWLPVEDTGRPCNHVWWCDAREGWSKPGDRCQWDCAGCTERDRERKPDPEPARR